MAEELIGPLFTEHGQQRREAAKRKRSHDQISVAESEVDLRVADGWEVLKKLQRNKVRVQRPISTETLLENRLWLLFYLMGYPELGGGRDFKIQFTRKND